jgi:hypothetical protein
LLFSSSDSSEFQVWRSNVFQPGAEVTILVPSKQKFINIIIQVNKEKVREPVRYQFHCSPCMKFIILNDSVIVCIDAENAEIVTKKKTDKVEFNEGRFQRVTSWMCHCGGCVDVCRPGGKMWVPPIASGFCLGRPGTGCGIGPGSESESASSFGTGVG